MPSPPVIAPADNNDAKPPYPPNGAPFGSKPYCAKNPGGGGGGGGGGGAPYGMGGGIIMPGMNALPICGERPLACAFAPWLRAPLLPPRPAPRTRCSSSSSA